MADSLPPPPPPPPPTQAFKKKKQMDFIVTTFDPNDKASSRANRKRVRSVAALKSWPERRKKMFGGGLEEEVRGKGWGMLSICDSGEEGRKRKKKTIIGEIESCVGAGDDDDGRNDDDDDVGEYDYVDCTAEVPCDSSSSSSSKAVMVLSGKKKERKKRSTDVGSSSKKKKRNMNSATTVLLTPPRSPPPPPHPHPTRDLARGRADPFNSYSSIPIWQPWFRQILHYSKLSSTQFHPKKRRKKANTTSLLSHLVTTIYAPRGWPSLHITPSQGAVWETFLTQTSISSPALFYVRLLFGSGDLVRMGILPPSTSLWLRSRAILAITDAISSSSSDNQECCSDALILATGRIAMHEHMYGSREACELHRGAQKRMIEMRGGLEEGLRGFPELVRRLIRWGDGVLAVGLRTGRVLGGGGGGEGKEGGGGDDGGFTLKESVRAIEWWAPHEMVSCLSLNFYLELSFLFLFRWMRVANRW